MDNSTMVLIVYFVAMLLVLAMTLGAMVYSDRKNNELRLRAIEAMEKLAHKNTGAACDE